MRMLITLPALFALGACQVSKSNNEVSVTYNQDVAENAAADVGNTAENVANDIGADVEKTGAKLQNKVESTNVSVKIGNDQKSENKAEKK